MSQEQIDAVLEVNPVDEQEALEELREIEEAEKDADYQGVKYE